MTTGDRVIRVAGTRAMRLSGAALLAADAVQAVLAEVLAQESPGR